ncbi:sigma-54 dependent transcriptional regulator [uncultured Aquitalea sp.]|uniref:sigma-54-dependent transcriptional regulator n=1 Tax=uncultured Aquitalea sp. TaxID=540272 RepID=UPI0025D5CCB7|nr:sigma-54 dependent transcriptional regulator [uncultured Aquitalea sp.]
MSTTDALPLTILYVEDDPAVRMANSQTLELAGLPVKALPDAESALAVLRHEDRVVILSDVRLPGLSGLELLERAKQADAELPVILVTGHGDIAMAVAAMRAGAYDFIEKPYSADRLLESLKRAMEKRRLTLENRLLRASLAQDKGPVLIGRSPVMQALRQTLVNIADTDADVLIHGPTGSGKEMVAQALHAWSRRRQRHFVPLNCAGLPESVFESEIFGHEAGAFTGALKRRIGKIEYASGGTLFLDEIEGMPLGLQAKLLRVLQQRVVERLGSNSLIPVDCRVVAATKEDLAQASAEKRFREDLYYRLNVVTLRLPALKERPEDIPELFQWFAEQAAERFNRPLPELTPALAGRLQAQAWPGNVRELRNCAERFVLGVMPGEIGNGVENNSSGALEAQVDAYEKQLIEQALRLCKGQVVQTAEQLGLPRKTLYNKMARHGLLPEDFRAQ